MGAPPPSSGGVYVRVEILSPNEPPPRADFWTDVNAVLDHFRNNSPLRLKRFPPTGQQRGYEAKLAPNGDGVEHYKDLRKRLSDLLGGVRPVNEWTQVKYGLIEGGGDPLSLRDLFPQASNRRSMARKAPASKASAKKKTKKRG
jgi:hypothetical protein